MGYTELQHVRLWALSLSESHVSKVSFHNRKIHLLSNWWCNSQIVNSSPFRVWRWMPDVNDLSNKPGLHQEGVLGCNLVGTTADPISNH
jgi:hypothetical protein